MGSGSNRKGEIFFLLLIGIAFALLLYFGSDFGNGFSIRKSAGWDPFTPILKGLSGLGQAITNTFSGMLP